MNKTKEMLISVDDLETRVAVLENNNLTDLYTERVSSPPSVGNIYLGKVQNVLPGMEAAFVDIGLERNAFLYVEELALPPEELEIFPKKIQQLLKVGQEISVQVVREPKGTKGARVTSQITLAGRYLVLVPRANFMGVSRRLPLEEREKLRNLGEAVKPKNKGVILRTAAKDKSVAFLKNEVNRLLRHWRTIEKNIAKLKAPSLIHKELDLFLRVVRDVFSDEFERLMIDSPLKYKRIATYLKQNLPELRDRVELYREKIPLFDRYNVESQIKETVKRKIWLKSGGYIAIDQTEALTAIDVNTGKYVGKSSLEETILKTNLEAAKEVARQLRLRDIGGIIVIDFIDMENPLNRDDVFLTLNESLGEDRSKSKVVEVSHLGLVEMTRKSTSGGLREFLGEGCPHCRGKGWVLSPETLFLQARREINKICLSSAEDAFLFKLNPVVVTPFLADKKRNLVRLERSTRKRLYIWEDSRVPATRYELVKKGTRKEIEQFLASKPNGLPTKREN